MIPQLIYLTMLTMGIGVSLARIGQPEKPQHPAIKWIAFLVTQSLLYWGGFYDVFFR